jgi:hypothetical protein
MDETETIDLRTATPEEVDVFLSGHSISFRRMEVSGMLILDDDDMNTGEIIVVHTAEHRAEFAPAPPVAFNEEADKNGITEADLEAAREEGRAQVRDEMSAATVADKPASIPRRADGSERR